MEIENKSTQLCKILFLRKRSKESENQTAKIYSRIGLMVNKYEIFPNLAYRALISTFQITKPERIYFNQKTQQMQIEEVSQCLYLGNRSGQCENISESLLISGNIQNGRRFDFLKNKSYTQFQMGTSRYLHRTVYNKKEQQVFIISGTSGEQQEEESYTSKVEVFDIQKKCFRYVQSIPQPKRTFGASLLNNKIYLIGGYDSLSVEHYDIFTDSWKKEYPQLTSTGSTTSASVVKLNSIWV